MATIEFKGIEEYSKRLARLGAKAEAACKYSIYDAAGMVIEAIKEATPVDTGDLRDSLTLKPMVNADGYVYTKVEFSGYDRKGTPNPLKAAAIESGRSNMRKRPFIRPAVKRVERAAQFAMETALNEYLSKAMK